MMLPNLGVMFVVKSVVDILTLILFEAEFVKKEKMY